MARKSAWGSAAQTIRELLGVPEVKGKTSDEQRDALRAATKFDPKDDAPAEVKAALLFTQATFRALFEHVPDNTRVSDLVVSAYHALSTQTLVEGLHKALPSKPGVGNWKAQLAECPKKAPPPPALNESGYRWSFVRDKLPDLLPMQIERARDRRERLAAAPVAEPESSLTALPVLFLGALVDGIQYLVDADGHPLYALGQGHVTAAQFIADCAGGATIRMMSPIEALRLPWADTLARDAWDGPVREAMALFFRRATDDFDTAHAVSEQLRFGGSISAATEVIDKPGRVRPPL
jgi:FAD/FMN-containing dehydrogenase